MADFVAEVAVRVRPLSPSDSLARAAEAVRTAPGGAVPVEESGTIVGMVAAPELDRWIADAGPIAAAGATVCDVVQAAPPPLTLDATITEALERLRESGWPALPVVNHVGQYAGMVSRGELLSAVMGALRPPLVGGMATPFGVYLTDGTRRGGVGDGALISSGIFMSMILIIGSWLGYRLSVAIMALLAHAAPAVSHLLSGAAPPTEPPALLYSIFSLLIFAGLFRLSWVTGYHAAEHQVVHAIEQGDDLRTEVVQTKPRVHPRCGTNLMVAFGMFMLLNQWAGSLAFIGSIFAWRFFGPLMQHYITTRPARGWELESGLRAGRELLGRYQSGIGKHASGWQRLWNMGLLQGALGFGIAWGLLFLCQHLLHPGTLEATWFNNYLWG